MAKEESGIWAEVMEAGKGWSSERAEEKVKAPVAHGAPAGNSGKESSTAQPWAARAGAAASKLAAQPEALGGAAGRAKYAKRACQRRSWL